MNRYNLAISFFLKDKIKKNHPIEFDRDVKTWYIEVEGDLPEDLQKYREKDVDISYEDRNEYKAQFHSLRWDKMNQTWKCSEEEYEKIELYRENN